MGRSRREAPLECLSERGPVQVLADEHERVHSRLGSPFAVELCVEEHVDALEDKTLCRTLDGEDALHAVDVVSLGTQEAVYPRVDPRAVQFACLLDSHRGDTL